MIILKGRVVEGARDFCWRMTEFAAAFRNATGEYLYPGTLNIKVEREIPIKEQFRIRGKHLGDPRLDILFETCRINRLWAYRAQLCDAASGKPVRAPDILDIICAQRIPNSVAGSPATVVLLRDDLSQPHALPSSADGSSGSLHLVLPDVGRIVTPSSSRRGRKLRSANS